MNRHDPMPFRDPLLESNPERCASSDDDRYKFSDSFFQQQGFDHSDRRVSRHGADKQIRILPLQLNHDGRVEGIGEGDGCRAP
jgi:hypothetical protein